MDILKQQLQQQLVSNVIKDKLKNNENVIFDESRCTLHRCIRFSDAFLRKLIMPVSKNGGRWETGDFLIYEVNLSEDTASAVLSFDYDNIPAEYESIKAKLSSAYSIVKDSNNYILKKWQFRYYPGDIAAFQNEFDNFINLTVPAFEKEVTEKLKDIHEGEKDTLTSTRYERNPLARKMCLDYYGTACMVCGMDFGKTFGPEFAGKIEVHHIVPVSEIGKDYIIDPIKDLIPLCPNCHTAIHSKNGGTYTIEELKNAMRK